MGEEFHSFTRYLEKTLLQDVLHTALQDLVSPNELPYNPYPKLVQQFRRYMERFTPINEVKIDTILGEKVIPCFIPYLHTTEGCQQVWGTPTILAAIDKSVLQKFHWLLDSIIPSPSSLCISDTYSNQVMVSLGGPIIFQGTFYPEPDNLQVFQEHLIIGPERKKAIPIFVATILQDMEMMRKSTLHFLIELWIGEENSDEQSSKWSPHQIDNQNIILTQSLTRAVEDFMDIKIKYIFRLFEELPKYCSGEKIFRMSFMRTFPLTGNQETLEMFSRHPTSTLYQSVFLHQNHAEAFFSLNRQNLDAMNRDQQFPESGRPISTMRDTRLSRHSSADSKLQTRVPDSSILQNLMMAWQKIIGTNEELEFFDTVYYTILIYILNRHVYPSDLLKELYQLLHCTLGRLNSLMKKIKMLQDLSEKLLNIGDTSILVEQLKQLKQYAQDFLLNSKEERSSNIICLGRTFDTKVLQIIEATASTPEQVSYLLRELGQYLQAPFLEMLEDTLDHCPNFQKLVSTLREFFQDTNNQKSKKKKYPEKILSPMKILHETDDVDLNIQEELVVNVKECLKDNPGEFSKSKVLIKYLLDVHLDEIWEEYLTYVLMGKPINPYPWLITKLRQSAMKMNLFSHSNEELYEMLSKPNGVYLVDSTSHVYCLPEVSVYGPITALSLVNVSILKSILARIPEFWDQPVLQQPEGPYKVTTSLGIGGWALLYGTIQPYINEIRTYQHFYIEGPIGCEKVAVEMFASYTLDDIRRKVDANETPVLGIQLGEENPKYFTVEDLQLQVRTLPHEIEQAAFEKQSVCLQYLMKWNRRYFSVLKFYQLHFITQRKIGNKSFCLLDSLSFYQTIFPTAEKASFHYQNNGPFHGGDPCSISNFNMASSLIKNAISDAKNQSRWLDVHRLDLLKYLIVQFGPNQMAQEHKAETLRLVNCTCTCWRMLHSSAAQIEYVVHCLQVLHCLMAILTDQCPDVKFDQWMDMFYHKRKEKLDNNSKMASFCVNTILETTSSLCKKLKSVLSSPVVMIGETLKSVILRKMDTVLEQDLKTGLNFPKQDEKALDCVKEIIIMLQSIQDALCEDAHNACQSMVI